MTAAAATARLLGLIARDDLGIPAGMIRTDALSAAGLIFAAVSFGTLLRRRKSRRPVLCCLRKAPPERRGLAVPSTTPSMEKAPLK